MLGLVSVLALSGSIAISLGALASSPILVLLGLSAFLLLVALRFRLTVVMTSDSVTYTGLLGHTKNLRFSEITSVRRPGETGYLASRWYGPSVYELQGPRDTMRINLKLFPIELGEALLNALEARGLTSRSRS